MKKLSEVSKIVGVTRRTLQEYEKVGLVVPTSKTESGYWLYDNTAIQKLMLVQIFVEGGYERKAIKALMDSPTLDMIQEFDRLIGTLEEKRKRIDGMINTIKTLKLTARLPETTLRVLGNMDVTRIYQDKSFSSYLEDSIANSGEYSEIDSEEAEMYIPFWYNIIAIGCLMGKPVESEEVQSAVKMVCKELIEMALSEEDDPSDDVDMTESEIAEVFYKVIEDVLNDGELRQMVEQQCGKGAIEYIVRAAGFYSDAINGKGAE